MFMANPFGFTRKLLGDKCSDQLACSAEEVNAFLHDTLGDPMREQELEPNRALINPAPPTTMFDLREPSLKEVEEIINAACSASAPGPSGVPYIVYKCCP